MLVSGLVNGDTSPNLDGDGDLPRRGLLPQDGEGMESSGTMGRLRSPGFVATGDKFSSASSGSVKFDIAVSCGNHGYSGDESSTSADSECDCSCSNGMLDSALGSIDCCSCC